MEAEKHVMTICRPVPPAITSCSRECATARLVASED